MSHTFKPRVSALVSTYASADFIGECLQDLAAQTIADQLEIVVVDAASPEREADVVREFEKIFPRIVYHRTPVRIGIYAAWNLAIGLASGDLLLSASTNDRLAPDACETLAEELERHPQADLVYGDSYLTEQPHRSFRDFEPGLDRDGGMIWPPFMYEELLVRCLVGPHAMWRASVHQRAGLFDESYRALGDQDMWHRIFLAGGPGSVRHVHRFTGVYWQSPDALSVQDHTLEELDRIRCTYLSRYLQRPELRPHGPEVDRLLGLIQSGNMPLAAAEFAGGLLSTIVYERFAKFSSRLSGLVAQGRVYEAMELYKAERDHHARLDEIAELDALMHRIYARAA